MNAAELEIGEQILSLDGDYGTVEANVTIFDANQRMYNLTVEDAHTFFVGDGDWLVHNEDYGDYPPSIRDPQTGQMYNRPTVPETRIASRGQFKAEHYYHGNDHAPAHIHILKVTK